MRSVTASLILSVILIGNSPARAQGVPGNSASFGKGSVLTYKVKENRNTFNFIVSITKFVDKGTIAYDWTTDETVPRKGHTSMKYGNLNTATNLLVKIPGGDESLGPDESRVFMSEPMTKDISEHLSEFKTDGNDRNFLFVNLKQETVKINYNDKITDMDTRSGEDNGIYINVMDLEKVSLLASYSDKQFTFELSSISNNGVPEQVQETPEKAVVSGQPKKMSEGMFAGIKMLYPTLAMAENYDPTDGGAVTKPFTETYDYRLSGNNDNPPSYIDAFIVDLSYIYSHKEKFQEYLSGNLQVTDHEYPVAVIQKIFDVYLNMNATVLYGFRPWTHQRFLKSLGPGQLKKLAAEASAYIAKIGFREK